MRESNYRKVRSDSLICSEIDDEILIYDTKTDRAHSLNRTAVAIWELCDGQRSIRGIRESLSEAHPELATDEVVIYGLRSLEKAGLVEGGQETPTRLDRRKLAKKLGIAAAASLPIVSSIVVPPAANAQSLLPSGAPCQNGPQCASGQCIGVGGGAKVCR